jgi:signal transduction histidine kinase/PAS domain-containing protein
LLLIVSALTGQAEVLTVAVFAFVIGAAAFFQMRRGRPRPLPLLIVGSLASATSLPFAGQSIQAAALPTLAMLVFIGIFALPRPVSIGYAIWCGMVAIWTLPWAAAGAPFREMIALVLQLGAVGLAGWKLLTLAGDTLVKEQERFRLAFDSSPVATWEEDFTAVGQWLDSLRAAGVRDLRTYLMDHPQEARKGASLIKVLRVNPAAARLVEAGSTDQVVDSFADITREGTELDSFVEQFIAIWDERHELALDLKGVSLTGNRFEGILHWAVSTSQGRPDLSRVMVTISDITPRKIVEEQLAAALMSEQKLLSYEHAIATCSRVLLLGTGEDALDVTLRTLCEATGAQSAYLTVNFDDPEYGRSFRLANVSSTIPLTSRDDGNGKVFSWNAFPGTWAALSKGETFRQAASEGPGESILGNTRIVTGIAAPIFIGERWAGTLGFENTCETIDWPDEAINLILIAAPMLGTYWERERTRERLEELVRSKDQFVASVSHELRTPLAAVLGFAEELKNRASHFQPQELNDMLELIADQSKEMSDMVEDLLVAARADIGTIAVRPQEIYLRALTEATVAGLGPSPADRIQVVGGSGKCWADPTRARQIIRNLLTNAVRYGGDRIVADAATSGGVTVLTVRDNGPGLPASEWQRIFEPYQRAHDRPTQPGSIGLGLTVSRQLAQLMGGDLSYRSEHSESIFELTLPSTNPNEGPERPSHTARPTRPTIRSTIAANH